MGLLYHCFYLQKMVRCVKGSLISKHHNALSRPKLVRKKCDIQRYGANFVANPFRGHVRGESQRDVLTMATWVTQLFARRVKAVTPVQCSLVTLSHFRPRHTFVGASI